MTALLEQTYSCKCPFQQPCKYQCSKCSPLPCACNRVSQQTQIPCSCVKTN